MESNFKEEVKEEDGVEQTVDIPHIDIHSIKEETKVMIKQEDPLGDNDVEEEKGEFMIISFEHLGGMTIRI